VSGLALIAGSVGMILAMGLHPTGHDLFAQGNWRPQQNWIRFRSKRGNFCDCTAGV
jgi:hypothetical protein